MTDKNHPITPPPEIVAKIRSDAALRGPGDEIDHVLRLIYIAYRAGADMELDACCDWFRASSYGLEEYVSDKLRAARRPKPPSLKEQALGELREIPIDPESGTTYSALETIRRALESLPS